MKLLSRWWYVVSIGLAVAAVGGGAIAGFSSLRDRVAGFHRVVVPGQTSLQLSAGNYHIFYEQVSLQSGKQFTSASGNVNCRLTHDQAEVRLEIAKVETQYSIAGYQGRSVFWFEAPSAGIYQLVCELKSNAADERAMLAIGTDVKANILGLVMTILGPAFLGVAGVLFVFFKRRKARRFGSNTPAPATA